MTTTAYTFDFDLQSLDIGDYTAQVEVIETNTAEQYGVMLEFPFTIAATFPSLSDNTDTDFDGFSDLLEGVSDSDLDGIPDYLDDDANTAILPTGTSEQAISTLDGYRLTVGDIAKLANGHLVNTGTITLQDVALYAPKIDNNALLYKDIYHQPIQEMVNFNIENTIAKMVGLHS